MNQKDFTVTQKHKISLENMVHAFTYEQTLSTSSPSYLPRDAKSQSFLRHSDYVVDEKPV